MSPLAPLIVARGWMRRTSLPGDSDDRGARCRAFCPRRERPVPEATRSILAGRIACNGIGLPRVDDAVRRHDVFRCASLQGRGLVHMSVTHGIFAIFCCHWRRTETCGMAL